VEEPTQEVEEPTRSIPSLKLTFRPLAAYQWASGPVSNLPIAAELVLGLFPLSRRADVNKTSKEYRNVAADPYLVD